MEKGNMPELVFAYNHDRDIAALAGLDFDSNGKIYIMVGDIAPQGLTDEIWYAIFDTQQTIYDIADDLEKDLGQLYPNAEIIVDRDTSFTEFRKSVFTPESVGAVFIGHGREGTLYFTDTSVGAMLSITPTDLQFLLLFACEAGIEENGDWQSLTRSDVYYAPKGALYMDLRLPFLDSIASEAEHMIAELKFLKVEWEKAKLENKKFTK
jgi:hypothetical protein